MTMFYYEEKNSFGQFSPRISYDDRPSNKTPAGTKREIRNVQEVPPEMEMFGLTDLQRHFNPPTPIPSKPSTQPFDDRPVLIDYAIQNGATEMPDGDGYHFSEEALLGFIRQVMNPKFMLTMLADEVHADNVKAGWWTDLHTGEDLHGKRNVGEMLCLVHSEISEAMEGHRKKLMDDKLPHHPMLKVELIDAMIRILDLLGSEGNQEHPAGLIFQEKREFNANRADHKPENRLADGGKAF